MSEEWNQEEKKAEETAGAGEVHKEQKGYCDIHRGRS